MFSLIKLVTEQRCSVENDYILTVTQKKIYAFKGAVSVLFGLKRKIEGNYIRVCSFNYRKTFDGEISGMKWNTLIVEEGLGLGYDIVADGYP